MLRTTILIGILILVTLGSASAALAGLIFNSDPLWAESARVHTETRVDGGHPPINFDNGTSSGLFPVSNAFSSIQGTEFENLSSDGVPIISSFTSAEARAQVGFGNEDIVIHLSAQAATAPLEQQVGEPGVDFSGPLFGKYRGAVAGGQFVGQILPVDPVTGAPLLVPLYIGAGLQIRGAISVLYPIPSPGADSSQHDFVYNVESQNENGQIYSLLGADLPEDLPRFSDLGGYNQPIPLTLFYAGDGVPVPIGIGAAALVEANDYGGESWTVDFYHTISLQDFQATDASGAPFPADFEFSPGTFNFEFSPGTFNTPEPSTLALAALGLLGLGCVVLRKKFLRP